MPNLHDALHCDADILQLDVVAVGEVMAVPLVTTQPVDAASDEISTVCQ